MKSIFSPPHNANKLDLLVSLQWFSPEVGDLFVFDKY